MRKMSVLVTLLLVVTAAPARAEPPEVVPPEPVELDGEFPTGFPCAFPLAFQLEGKAGGIQFEDRAILTAPGLTAQLTNLDTDSTVELVTPGTLHDTVLSATRIRTKAVGRNVLFGFFDGDPGMFLTIGKIVMEWEVTDPLSFDLIESESPGRMIDVCKMLAG